MEGEKILFTRKLKLTFLKGRSSNRQEKGTLTSAHHFARTLSYAFDGSVISIPVFTAIAFYFVEEKRLALYGLGVCIFFGIFIPYFFVLLLYKLNRISDLHITHRNQRIKPLIIANISYLTGYLLLRHLAISSLLTTLFLIYFVTVLILTSITFFWKISFHTGWITFFTITLFVLFRQWASFSLALIPLMAWARIKLKKHTLLQTALGSLVAGTTTLLFFHLNGFLIYA